MLIFLFYTLWNYAGIPLKDERFLFLMVLPIAYFSYIFFEKIIVFFNVKRRKKFLVTLILAGAILLTSTIIYVDVVKENPFYGGFHYYQTLDWLEENNLSECAVSSNEWVPLSYIGRWAEPFPETDQLLKFINRGEIVILYKYSYEPAYMLNDSYLKDQPLLYNDSRLVIIGNTNCSKDQPVFDRTFLEQKQILFQTRFNVTVNTNACLILFHDKLFLEKICNFVNGDGFEKNKNRIYLP
jgi:hypothetical protein